MNKKQNNSSIQEITLEGKKRIEKEILELEKELKNEFNMRNFDRTSENFDKESFLLEIARITEEIGRRKDILKNSKIIENKEKDSNVVNVDDIIYLSLEYGEDDIEENYYHLISGGQPDVDENGFEELSVNCVIGATILGKPLNSITSCNTQAGEVKINIGDKYTKEITENNSKVKVK